MRSVVYKQTDRIIYVYKSMWILRQKCCTFDCIIKRNQKKQMVMKLESLQTRVNEKIHSMNTIAKYKQCYFSYIFLKCFSPFQ